MASSELRSAILVHANLIAALIGAAGSLTLMSIAGRHQRSPVLILLFAVWVLSPYVALVFARSSSMYWGVSNAGLFFLTLAITLGCLGSYTSAGFGYIRAKAGFIFLIVPLLSWIAIAITFVAASLTSSTSSRKSNAT